MRYRVGPVKKKRVIEVENWSRGDEKLSHLIGKRWASVLMDDKPDLSNYDPETDEINVYDDWNCELEGCDDVCWEDWRYPPEWSQEQIDQFQEQWDEEWHEAPLNMGFREEDTELWFSGPISVTEIQE